jgi:F-type H+-transporting ATPase subunit delta
VKGGRALQHELAQGAWRASGASGAEATGRSLTAVARILARSAKLRQVLLHPRVPMASKDELLRSLADLTPASTAVVHTLITRRSLGLAGGVARSFESLRTSRSRETLVLVRSAGALSKAEVAQLAAVLATALGKPVKLAVSTDRALLGGLEVRIGETIVDGTVKGAFDRLEQTLLSESSGTGRN